MAETLLMMWTVYAKPRDYPDKYVARRFDITAGNQAIATDEVLTADNIADIRREMRRRRLYCMPRFVGDDPVIVETWI